jgi:voltage-gated potassium channel
MTGLFSISDHVIVCGYGSTAQAVARDLTTEGVPIVVVDKSAEQISLAESDGHATLLGDVLDPEVLKEAGVERARGSLILVPSESDSLFAVMTTRELSPDIFIIARYTSAHARDKLFRAGADRAVNPFDGGTNRIGAEFVRPAVMDLMRIFSEATSDSESEVRVREITLAPQSSLVGQSLREADVRAQLDIIVIAMRKAGDSTRFNPDPARIFEAGDVLVCMGRLASLKTLYDMGRGVAD